ncbi:hypothetical protein BDY17DRAFT_327201 [Neohortaea acidophila]|uniref:NADAR domain-containing protein n=1 Tax=Neohortaea acidophila TaxID=245834 RepID=A0A6A6PJI4_9PEZI|nr:uncharacterized protein BDY17DRAFT_327201 [Neohortaea acidophila]KAF2480228.1 hypothetical protein BDY17DRAFT_327201 [Neohortaea acidophila]
MTDSKGPRWIGDNLPSLPPELQYAQDLPPKVTEKYVLFFGFDGPEPECCLQQWYPSPFVEKVDESEAKRSGTSAERKFKTSEQYMMFHKALLMGDAEVAGEVLECQTPGEAKGLGRKVKNFQQTLWDKHCDDIVEQGQYLKFSQNAEL